MGDGNFSRKLVGGFCVLAALALVVWVVLGMPGLRRADIGTTVTFLFISTIVGGSGAFMLGTRREDFEKRPTEFACASCDYKRRSEPGDACPECGSSRLVLPRLNRLAVSLLGLVLGVPPAAFLISLLFRRGAAAWISEPTVVVILTASLFGSMFCGFVIWQGRLPNPVFTLGMKDELEKILYSRTHALATILACCVVLLVMTVVIVHLV